MTGKRKTGNIGEDIAADFLKRQGYTILCRNYTVRGGEIDIVARIDTYLVFAEVKLRKNNRYGAPRAAVTPKKKAHLVTAAERYLYEKREDGISMLQPRFDCIEILLSDLNRKETAVVRHLVNFEL